MTKQWDQKVRSGFRTSNVVAVTGTPAHRRTDLLGPSLHAIFCAPGIDHAGIEVIDGSTACTNCDLASGDPANAGDGREHSADGHSVSV